MDKVRRALASFAMVASLLVAVWQGNALFAEEQKAEEDGAASGDDGEAAAELPTEEGTSLLDSLRIELHGFWELSAGIRTQKDPHESEDATLGESRLQIDLSKALDWAQFRAKSDFVYDGVLDEFDVDLREANALFTPFDFLDLKVGRQILTWGTGDYLFINDLFPKDWKSFLIGREDEYLKAPSDAIKASVYSDLANLDLVYTPVFAPDRFIDGERLSYFNPLLGRLAGEDAKVHTRDRSEWFSDSEMAGRIYRTIKTYDVAFYGYSGFWKSPVGFDPLRGKSTFPRLSAYGGSVRGKVATGIGNIELAQYDSRDDRSGKDPFVPNSEFRILAGYEQEVAKDFTIGGQYYLEHMNDYSAYKRSLPPGAFTADEDRHVLTIRLTKLLMYQNLRLSLFTFYSPSDNDVYLRPSAHYRINDHWSITGGANIFFGEKEHTFFGQFEDNTNVYMGMRYSF